MTTTLARDINTLGAPPVVGERYRVPGVIVPLWDKAIPQWYPVLGLAHTDTVAIKASKHFHFDVRFFPRDIFPLYRGDRLVATTAQDFMVKVHFVRGPEPKVIWRVVECNREQPAFPTGIAPWYDELAAVYSTAIVKDGKCPHQGFCLTNLAQDEEGVVMCPGHGLRWNLATGRLA